MSAAGDRASDPRLDRLTPAQRALLEQRLLKRRAEAAQRNTIPRRAQESPCELSYSQELLWLLSQVFDDGVAYNAPGSFHLEGPLDLEILRRAFACLMERHQILRTTYTVIDGRPMQVINQATELELNVVDLRSLAAQERDVEAQRVLKEESRFHFDLVRGPVVRPTIIRLADDEHIMMLNVHHVATDGYSRTALYRDLTAFYDAIARGASADLPELAIQYADYAVWHRRWLDGGIADKQLEYWRAKLAGAPSRLDLPTDFPRPPVRSYVGDHMSSMIDAATREGLWNAARGANATMFTALLALFATLLTRYAGQDEVVIGTPFAGRNRAELDSVVGYFINPLALRLDLSGDPTFDELLVRTRDTIHDAFANADVPYESVVRATNPQRDLSQTPVFQAMIVYHNPAWETERPKFEPEGFRSVEISHEKGWSKFDVLLGASERKLGLNTTWEYSTELFATDTVARMMGHMRALAESVAAGSSRRLSRLSMLSDAERVRLVTGWNSNPAPDPGRPSIKESFEAQVKLTPDAIAVVGEDQRITYADLNRQANRIAWRLRAQGVGPETLVGISMEKSPELVATVLGVIKSGGAYVPLDPAYPAERLEFMVADAEPKLLLSHERLRESLPAANTPVLFVDDPDTLAGQSDEDPPSVGGPDDLAYVIFTSGSTGLPKGVMVTQGGLAGLFSAYAQEYRLRDLRAHAQMASFSFDVFSGDVIRALLAGAKLVLCPLDVVLDPARLYELWSREGVDAVELVPATAALLFDYVQREGLRLDFMRFIAIGGEAWRTDRFNQYRALVGPETRLVNSYGLTEATMDSTYFEPAADDQLALGRVMPIGRPLPNSRVYVLGDDLEPQPIGIPGELCIGGEGIARGYLKRDELTAERFVADPFREGGRMYRTGDLARWTADGVIEFVGRADRQLKIRGFRVEPGEIEAVLERHPDVHAAAVIDHVDELGDTRLIAYLETGANAPDAADVRAFVADRVPKYMVPAAFVMLEALPLNPNGKVDRNALPEPALQRAVASADYVAPANDLERSLAVIWQRLLGVERVGALDNFFDLGGHSLLVVSLTHAIEQELGRTCGLAAVFRSPTIRGLAQELYGERNHDEAPIVLQLQSQGTDPPLFCICGVHVYQSLANELAPEIPTYGIFLPLEQGILEAELNGEFPRVTLIEMARSYLEAVRSKQPHGPYLLLGLCFGGTVAYEVARQLQAQGEEVALLVMLDSGMRSAINRPQLRPRLRRIKRAGVRHARDMSNAVRGRLGMDVAVAELKSENERLKLRRLRAFGMAARDYQPAHYDSPAVLIRPIVDLERRRPFLTDETYGWGQYMPQLEIYDVPGDHFSHLEPPHVDTVAAVLRPHLDRARAGIAEADGRGDAVSGVADDSVSAAQT